MNKGDLINRVAESASISKADATSAVGAVLDSITDTLKGGGKITLIGFGTFSVTHRAERQGRNPQTGASITIAAKNSVKFKAGSGLDDAVNGK